MASPSDSTDSFGAENGDDSATRPGARASGRSFEPRPFEGESQFRPYRGEGASGGYPPGGWAADGDFNPDRLVNFMEKWGRRLAPQKAPMEAPPASDPNRFSFTLFFLKLLPFVTGAGFVASTFFWDFSGSFSVPWRSEPIPLDGLLRMLSVTGLVGFGTNWLAIKMLFYPRKKRPLLGQGLIPSRKDRIVTKLGEQISREIINSELIVQQIRKSGLVSRHRENLTESLRGLMREPEFRSDILGLTQHYVTQFLRSREFQERIKDFVKGIDFENVGMLEGGVLRLYKMLTGDQDISSRLQQVIQNLSFSLDKHEEKMFQYLESLPDALEDRSEAIEDFALNAIVFLIEQVNVQSVIVENLQRFDEVRLERLLWRSTSDQLQYIQYLGCFLGIIGGLFIWMPLESVVVMGSLALGVWGLDTLLMRLKEGPAANKPQPDDDDDED